LFQGCVLSVQGGEVGAKLRVFLLQLRDPVRC
jgi:hypothetical protein